MNFCICKFWIIKRFLREAVSGTLNWTVGLMYYTTHFPITQGLTMIKLHFYGSWKFVLNQIQGKPFVLLNHNVAIIIPVMLEYNGDGIIISTDCKTYDRGTLYFLMIISGKLCVRLCQFVRVWWRNHRSIGINWCGKVSNLRRSDTLNDRVHRYSKAVIPRTAKMTAILSISEWYSRSLPVADNPLWPNCKIKN